VLGLPPDAAVASATIELVSDSSETPPKSRPRPVASLSRRVDELPPLEDYAPLRLRVEQLRRQRVLRSLVVTSAADADGRTTTSLQLARSFAEEAGLDVGLVDLDLTRPGLSGWLEQCPEIGVEDVLAGKAPLEDAVTRVGDSRLFVLASRGNSPDPWEDVALVSVARLGEALHKRFDLVLVDAPALLAPGVAPELVSQFDGWLFVIRAGVTTTEQIDQVLSRLDGDRLLGTVLNRSRLAETGATSRR